MQQPKCRLRTQRRWQQTDRKELALITNNRVTPRLLTPRHHRSRMRRRLRIC